MLHHGALGIGRHRLLFVLRLFLAYMYTRSFYQISNYLQAQPQRHLVLSSSIVVRTNASHALDRRFDPGREYFVPPSYIVFFFTFYIHLFVIAFTDGICLFDYSLACGVAQKNELVGFGVFPGLWYE